MCSETSRLSELMRFFLACCPPYWVLCLLLLPSARSKVACSSRALELEVPQVAPGGLSVGYSHTDRATSAKSLRPHSYSPRCPRLGTWSGLCVTPPGSALQWVGVGSAVQRWPLGFLTR